MYTFTHDILLVMRIMRQDPLFALITRKAWGATGSQAPNSARPKLSHVKSNGNLQRICRWTFGLHVVS